MYLVLEHLFTDVKLVLILQLFKFSEKERLSEQSLVYYGSPGLLFKRISFRKV